jgi:putative flippase GtrA
VRTVLSRFRTVEMLSFLVVGGIGYVVDVGAFNVLWGAPPFDRWDPSIAKTTAVALAMVVTYLGNAFVTWRGRSHSSLRQVLLFVTANVIGLGFSVLTLWISHDLLGLTTRLDDNVSANIVGLALGTAFRYWTYRHLVFDRAASSAASDDADTRPRRSISGSDPRTASTPQQPVAPAARVTESAPSPLGRDARSCSLQ